MRLFVAVELDDAVRAAAIDAAERLRRAIGERLSAKWVSPANMHLTVRFIGHVVDDRAPGLLEALAPPLPVAPFDVALGNCGVFPPHGPPRVLWIGLDEGLPSLERMYDEINVRLTPLGLPPEARPFSAHLTLARVKDAPRGSSATVREAIRAVHVTPVRCRINEAIVFESRLSPKGSTYNPLLHVPLRP